MTIIKNVKYFSTEITDSDISEFLRAKIKKGEDGRYADEILRGEEDNNFLREID